jgi:hypothetical protein
VLVPLAPATAVPGPAVPLPATRLRTHLSAVAVLSVSRSRAAVGRVLWADRRHPSGSFYCQQKLDSTWHDAHRRLDA